MNFGRILIKLGPNVDSLSIDPDSVSGKKCDRDDDDDSIGDRKDFCCQNPSPKSLKLRPHEDFSYLVTNLTTFLTTNRIIISSDENEDTKCKKDRFINRKTAWENTVAPESLIG